jgi:hypothetical protein
MKASGLIKQYLTYKSSKVVDVEVLGDPYNLF